MDDFTLSYQVQLAPSGDTINLDGAEEVSFEVAGHPCVLRVNDSWVTLKVSGLKDLSDAGQWMVRLRFAFAWATLQHDLPFKSTDDLRVVPLPDDWQARPRTPRQILGKEFPDGLDALENRGPALVYPTGAVVARIGMGNVSVSVGRAWKQIAASLNEGATLPPCDRFERVLTGLDLWSSAAYEVSGEARLLTYVMSIEALVAVHPKHARVQALIDEWSELLRQNAAAEVDVEVRESLEALRDELTSRREESVMKGLRRTVRHVLASAGSEEGVPQALKDLRTVYEARSKLVHEGTLRTAGAESLAKDLSRRVLIAALKGGLPG